MKKHKTWDGDGILAQEGLKITLFSENKKVCVLVLANARPYNPRSPGTCAYSMGSSTWNGDRLRSGTNLHVGGKEVELGDEIEKEDYLADNMDLTHSAHDTASASRVKAAAALSKFIAPVPSVKKTKDGIAANTFYASVAPAARNLAAGVPRYVYRRRHEVRALQLTTDVADTIPKRRGPSS